MLCVFFLLLGFLGQNPVGAPRRYTHLPALPLPIPRNQTQITFRLQALCPRFSMVIQFVTYLEKTLSLNRSMIDSRQYPSLCYWQRETTLKQGGHDPGLTPSFPVEPEVVQFLLLGVWLVGFVIYEANFASGFQKPLLTITASKVKKEQIFPA